MVVFGCDCGWGGIGDGVDDGGGDGVEVVGGCGDGDVLCDKLLLLFM